MIASFAHFRFAGISLGVIPLMIASVTRSEGQKVIGTALFGGMIVATFLCLATVSM